MDNFNLSSFHAVSCPAGCQTVNGTVCVPCEAGFYKVSAGRARCLPCPEGTTTPTEGAVSDSQCSVGEGGMF